MDQWVKGLYWQHVSRKSAVVTKYHDFKSTFINPKNNQT